MQPVRAELQGKSMRSLKHMSETLSRNIFTKDDVGKTIPITASYTENGHSVIGQFSAVVQKWPVKLETSYLDSIVNDSINVNKIHATVTYCNGTQKQLLSNNFHSSPITFTNTDVGKNKDIISTYSENHKTVSGLFSVQVSKWPTSMDIQYPSTNGEKIQSSTESPYAAFVFFVMDSNGTGGMILTSSQSRIEEDGVDGATIDNYTFTVPPVSGHYSNYDYGQVSGYNIRTNTWEVISTKHVHNGVTMSGTLPRDVYSKMIFYYYTDHHCMYNKSNITYSVEYYFDDSSLN